MATRAHNGPGFYYILEYILVDDPKEYVHSIRVPADQHCHAIPEQPTYSLYRIRIWAANELGRSTAMPVWIEGWSSEGSEFIILQQTSS